MSDAVALPSEVEAALQQLAAPAWRLRKQAVGVLRSFVMRAHDEPTALAALTEALLQRLTNPTTVDARGPAHEVLVQLGPACRDAVVARLTDGARGPGARLLVDLLGEVGDRSHVPRLVAMLDDPAGDDNLRAAAANALGTLGGPDAHRALRGLLTDGSQMLVVYALDALARTGVAVPVAEVEPLLSAELCRVGAVGLLGTSADVAALSPLVARLEDSMAGVRAAAVQALVALERGLGDRGTIVASAVALLPDAAKRRIRDLLGHSDDAVREAAIRLAGLAGDAEAIGVVLGMMNDPMVQERALQMVAAMGAGAATALAGALETADPAGREALFRLAAALPPGAADRGLIDAIASALETSEGPAALAAAEALAAVGDRGSLGGLYRAMSSPGRLGEAAADALASILIREGVQHADLDLIVGARWPQDGALAEHLCRVVGRLGDPRHVPQLVALLGSPETGVRIAAAMALGSLPGDHEGASALCFALADEEPQVRACACRSLGRLVAMSACQSLISATNDDSPMVRAAAVAALVDLDNPVTLARMRAIIVEDPVPTVVVQAIAGLGRSALEQDLTMLMSLCTSDDHEVVKAAARALSGFGAHRATAALLGLVSHERWDVRLAAAQVLAQRRDATALRPLRALAEAETDDHVRSVLGRAIETLGASAGANAGAAEAEG